MKSCIAETLDKQMEIIKLQAEIIDRLSLALMQHGAIADADLEMLQRAAKMQEEMQE